MFTINDLKPGDFVMPLPIGLQLTIQYNVEGNIEKVFTGYKDRTDVTHDIIGNLIAKKTVPAKISVNGCTTWVFGILYTSETVSKCAMLPEGIYDDLLQLYVTQPTRFNFFAASMETSTGSIMGSIAVRRALAMNQFKILPGWDMYTNYNEKLLSLWLQEAKFTFKPIITDIVSLGRDSGIKVVHLGAQQSVVKKTDHFVDAYGFLKTELTCSDDIIKYINYAEQVSYHIVKDTVIYENNIGDIVYSSTIQLAEPPAPVLCKKCGRRIEIPAHGVARCNNPHCVSRLVPTVQTFVQEMHLPMYGVDTIKKWVDEQKVTCIPDIFLLDEYSKCNVEVSVAKLLRAMIPYNIIARDDVLMLFTTACMENPKTIEYYMNNAEQIPNDLHIQHMDLPALIEWFNDPCNVSDMTNLLTIPQIHITEHNKKFDGAPIFRDKIIYITGTFLHGAMGYVSSILQSYAAKVTTVMSNNVDCVLVGGTHENVDGKAIVSARQMHIPVYEEIEFFNAYDIDSDIKNADNLV